MSQHRFVVALVVMALGQLADHFPNGQNLLAAENSPVSCRLATFQSAAGETYFALSLTPHVAAASIAGAADIQGRDIVVIVDTSASQVGEFRTDSIQTLTALLANLEDQDRVQLLALDIRPAPMSTGLHRPDSEQTSAGLEKLDRRVPLGSTDLVAGLEDSLNRIVTERLVAAPVAVSKRPGVVIYIGDGLSQAGAMKTARFKQLVERFVAEQVSVTSFAIGPSRDALSLAVLANHTGGRVFMDSLESNSEHFGILLARSVRSQVYWPQQIKLPSPLREVYPAMVPPLRSDRDTMVVGVMDEPADISFEMPLVGNAATLSFVVQPEPSNPDFAFLPQVISVARKNALLPTVGSVGLREAAFAMSTSSRQLTALGRLAMAHGDTDGAQKALAAAVKQDPSNIEARNALLAVEKFGERLNGEPIMRLVAGGQDQLGQDQLGQGQPRQDQLGVATDVVDSEVGSILERFDRAGGDELRSYLAASSVREQQVRTDVENSIRKARKRMERDAPGAIAELKQLLDSVMSVPEISSSVRAQLRRRVEAALRSTTTQLVVQRDNQAEAERSRLAGEESQRIADETLRREETIKELMEQFASLMDEGHYEQADDEIAEQVRQIAPTLPDAISATWSARFHRQVAGMERFRDMRHKNFADAMYAVEAALIPFPDRDPIIYPSPEFWQDITRKRAHYKSMDLSGSNPSEKRIYEALEKVESLPLLDSTLEELAAFLFDNFGIPAIVDEKALEDDAIPLDTQVTSNLSGMRLKSALRLTLRKHDLTYIIDDEVLQITTQTAAAEKQVTKVYPVGDLVIPPISFGGQGGGGFGGVGGQGGGGGGFGGGQGGFGGGGFGGGGFGGGRRGGFGGGGGFGGQGGFGGGGGF